MELERIIKPLINIKLAQKKAGGITRSFFRGVVHNLNSEKFSKNKFLYKR